MVNFVTIPNLPAAVSADGSELLEVVQSGVSKRMSIAQIRGVAVGGNVTSFSGGTTGLTPASPSTGGVTLGGVLVAGSGGTGLSSYAVGDILYANSTSTLTKLSVGANGTVLTLAAGVPTWAAGSGTGTVTTVSVASANGFAGSVTNPTTTPAITVSTTVTGIVKGNGAALSAAVADTDYLLPATAASTYQPLDADLTALAALAATAGMLSRTGAGAFAVRTIAGTSNRISVSNGSGAAGAPTIDVDAAYVGQASITTLGTIGTGTWQGGIVIGTYGGTGVNNSTRTMTYAGNVAFTGSFNPTFASSASVTHTLPGVAGTLATLAGTEAFTNKTYNGNTFTAGTGVLTIAAAKTLTANNSITIAGTDGKTLTVSNSITLAGTDATTMTFPPASASIGYINIPQNSQSAAYTSVLADGGKHIYHPGADTTARTWTIDSNANVAYPIGTAITFVNDTSGGVITIAITSDTLVLAGAGTTGSRTLAANGVATAIKMTTTRWIISGTGLT